MSALWVTLEYSFLKIFGLFKTCNIINVNDVPPKLFKIYSWREAGHIIYFVHVFIKKSLGVTS